MADLSLDVLVAALAGPSRRGRQEAAHEVALAAEEDASALVPFAEQLMDGLQRPEAQTRWELLNALSLVAGVDADLVEGAMDDAEAALFDEGSSMVRLAGFRFIAREGKSTPERSAEAWALLDEAVQCYHGDPEFREMLAALLEFAQGNISDDVKQAVHDRVAFDAEKSSMPFIKSYSEQIVEACEA